MIKQTIVLSRRFLGKLHLADVLAGALVVEHVLVGAAYEGRKHVELQWHAANTARVRYHYKACMQ